MTDAAVLEINRRYTWFFLLALIFLLSWSAWDYGGRYLHVQVLCQVMVAGFALMLALRLFRQHHTQVLLSFPLLKPSLLLLLSLGLSWIFSVNQLASLEEIFRWLMYLELSLCVYCWLSLAPEPVRAVRVLLIALLWLACLIVAWGLFSYTGAEGLTSTFNRTNDLAGYLLLLVPLGLYLTLQAQGFQERLLYAIPSLILTLALILTNSRSSWAAACLSCILVLYLQRRQLRLKAIQFGLIFAALALMLGVALNWHLVIPRLQTILSFEIVKENGTVWRLELLKGAWQMFLNRPLFGQGPNTFGTAFNAFQQQPGFYSINPHNFYLQALAETGLIGFLALVFWLSKLIRGLSIQSNPYSRGILAGLLASLLHIAFDIDWSVSAIPILFACLLGAGLVSERSLVSEDLADLNSDARLGGVLIFCALLLALVPGLNYFSARAYAQASSLMQEDPLEGEKFLNQAITLAPWPSGRHYASLAQLYLQKQELEPSLQAILKAIRLDAHNARYYGLAADILKHMNQPKASLAMLLRRVELNPYRHPHIYTELGDAYQAQGEASQALQWYRKGYEIFDNEALSHYDRYTPADRFEAFTLVMKLAGLYEKTNQPKLSGELRAKAQDLLRSAAKDLFVLRGYSTPVDAVLAYWKQVPEHYRSSAHSFDSLHPESQIPAPPPNLLDSERLEFLQAEREALFNARLVYAIPRKSKADSWLVFEDLLVGDETGWKIRQRRTLN